MDSAVSECLSNGVDETNAAIHKSLVAETIEVVPEIIPYNDSDEDDSDFNDDDDDGNDKKFQGNFYDYNDNEQEDFDEYGYQIKWNNVSEFDNERIRRLAMANYQTIQNDSVRSGNGATAQNSDVILIESEDDCSGGSGSAHATGFSSGHSSDRKIYECDICFRKVASSYNLKRHMMIHTGEKPYGCDICNRRFREFSDLKKHRRVHSAEKQFKCMTCHRNTPSATNATKCATCENKESTQKSLDLTTDRIIPRLDSNNKKSFVCNYCDRAFGSSSNLKRHIMIHTGEKPFTCKVCQRSFREMSTLKKHSFTHRNIPASQMHRTSSPVTQLKCYLCLKTFLNANLLKQHILSHTDLLSSLPEITMRPVPSKIYHHKCPKCNGIFYDSSKLMAHMCSVHKVNGLNETVAKTQSIPTATITTTKTPAATTTTKSSSLRKTTISPPPLIPINRNAYVSRNHHSAVDMSTLTLSIAQYFCKICCKKFRSQQHLQSHQLTHKK